MQPFDDQNFCNVKIISWTVNFLLICFAPFNFKALLSNKNTGKKTTKNPYV
ncbi:hypothetical protein CU014_0352 [Enterococcus xinjiangensis]|nr:hypothetical protein [Enterococcus lactis]MBL5004833.1 hypothetical protein [Enterococcus lactis]